MKSFFSFRLGVDYECTGITMLRNLFYVGVLFCLVACKDTSHQETDVRTIEVTDFSGQKQELNE